MISRSIRDNELLPLVRICKEVKIKPDTIHSLQRRHHILPKAIVVSKHVKHPRDPFKTKVRGREVLYSGRTVEYFSHVKKLKESGLTYKKIFESQDIISEKKLIELLHESNLSKDPLKKDEEFFVNFENCLALFVERVGGEDIAYYQRLSKDSKACYKEYELVNKKIEERAYRANFFVDDLIKEKKNIGLRLATFYGMMAVILKKIAEVARKDTGFRKEVVKRMGRGK